MSTGFLELLDQAVSEFDIPFVDYKNRALVGIREANGLVFVSGTACEDHLKGGPIWTGAVGAELSLEEGYKAARWCGLIQLNMLNNLYGLDRIEQIVRSFGLIQVADDFYDLDGVYDGYSDVMFAALRERGKHVRTVMGTRNLPNHHVTIEVETIAKLRD
ncbi:MAG: RidA family protein [Clostridiales bacterium]|jgi:enamine deaminase RidA (YjgF/YER057c/UK114 family)|nr:RidA family protein [Clostridiales bacterium]